MNDGTLLAFGCAVSLIAIAGVYAYLRESFTSEQKPLEFESHDHAVSQNGKEVHT